MTYSIFVICFSWKLPKVFSLVSFESVEWEKTYSRTTRCRNSKSLIFSLNYPLHFLSHFRLYSDFLADNNKFQHWCWLKTSYNFSLVPSILFQYLYSAKILNLAGDILAWRTVWYFSLLYSRETQQRVLVKSGLQPK